MSDDLGKPVAFKGPGQWRSQAETAQAHSRPPDAALEVLPEARRSVLEPPMRSEPVEGLDWDPVEYLLRAVASHGHYDPAEHRDAHGKWAKGGGSHLAPGGRPPGWPANAPPPRPASTGMSETAAGAPNPSVADLANMVADLRQQLAAQEPKLRTENAHQLHAVVEQMRTEERRLATQVAAEEKAADLKLEKRKALIRTIATILALLAVGLLIVATAGAALPPVAVAGVAVGPLLGGETAAAFGELSARRRTRARIEKIKSTRPIKPRP